MSLKQINLLKDILVEIGKNYAMGVPFIRKLRMSSPRTSVYAAHNPQNLDRFAFGQLRKVMEILGRIDGLHVTEIGPGDHIATGLTMLAAGAASYTSLDRFPGLYGSDFAKTWYRAVRASWPTAFPELLWPEWLDVEKFPCGYPERVRVIPFGIEEVNDLRRCDLVCSFLVGEHVLDLGAFARVTMDLLAANGVAIHIVDFSQHHNWSYYDDPFLFLRFPEWLWKLMGTNRGLPNRFRFHEFVTAFEETGLTVKCEDRVIAQELVNPASLAARFRDMPLDSVKTLGVIFFCSNQS